jgi:hypothetical protein
MPVDVEVGELRIGREAEDGKWSVARRVYVHGIAVIPDKLHDECAAAVRLRVLSGYEDRLCCICLRKTYDSEAEARSDQTAEEFETSAKKTEGILELHLRLPR